MISSLNSFPVGSKVQIAQRFFVHIRPGFWREDHEIHGNRTTRPAASLRSMEVSSGKPAVLLPDQHGYFVDWDGNVRLALEPGEGLHSLIDIAKSHLTVADSSHFAVHECIFFRTFEQMSAAGIQINLVKAA